MRAEPAAASNPQARRSHPGVRHRPVARRAGGTWPNTTAARPLASPAGGSIGRLSRPGGGIPALCGGGPHCLWLEEGRSHLPFPLRSRSRRPYVPWGGGTTRGGSVLRPTLARLRPIRTQIMIEASQPTDAIPFNDPGSTGGPSPSLAGASRSAGAAAAARGRRRQLATGAGERKRG